MRLVRSLLLLALAAPFVIPVALPAQDPTHAAWLLAYHLKPGEESAFEEGYRRHLAWHAEHRDSLPWFAWTVVEGAEPGMFVDGTFGITAAAFAARVAPDADRADAAATFLPHGTPAFLRAYRLRADLGGGARLEQRQPAPHQLVLRLVPAAGAGDSLERVLRSVAFPDDASIYARSDSAGADYLVIVQGTSETRLAEVRRTLVDPLLTRLRALVAATAAEVWRYRPELSLFPERSR
jgi:hypothetical protein